MEKSLGFVPTMGALHQGHVSLLETSMEDNNLSVVSIYVNPTQFNNPEDLEKYPRDTEGDFKKLETAGCDMVFLPSDESIYPNGKELIDFDLQGLDKGMEGEHRPGHFEGVVTVVDRLFDIIQPDSAYFGEKDYQQLAIIRLLAEERHPQTTVVGCRTRREADGLAMSSRNLRLTPEQREAAPLIYETLEACAAKKGNMNVEALISWMRKTINHDPLLEVEYISIVDPYTLKPLVDIDEYSEVRVCTAVFCGEIRLIDNIQI